VIGGGEGVNKGVDEMGEEGAEGIENEGDEGEISTSKKGEELFDGMKVVLFNDGGFMAGSIEPEPKRGCHVMSSRRVCEMFSGVDNRRGESGSSPMRDYRKT
jgi:hypothetical protein